MDKTVIKTRDSGTVVLTPSDKTRVIAGAGKSASSESAGARHQPLSQINDSQKSDRQKNDNQKIDLQKTAPKNKGTVTIGDCIKGRFDLLEVLGVGGMGVVYRARDRRQKELGESDPHLALKVLSEQLQHNESALVALQQECRKSQRLAHPNIVNVYDFDRDNNLAFMTMELLHGQSLDAVLYDKEFHGAPLEAIAPYLRQIASALQYAHDKGIIHSDFKPSNLFLTEEGGIKIFDFGIARVMQNLEGGADASHQLAALTPAYASLGMLTDQAACVGDDLYAFAVVIYFWLTGRHPYRRKTALQVHQQKLVPVRPRGLPEDAWKVLRAALDPERVSSLSVPEFIAGFLPEPNRLSPRFKWGVSVAAAVAICMSGYLGFHAWRNAQYASALASDDKVQIRNTLDRLSDLPDDRRDSIIQSEREALIQHVLNWVGNAEKRGHYYEALRYLDQFLVLFPDSQKLFHRFRELSRKADAEEESLAQTIREHESRLLRMSRENALEWANDLARLQRIDPAHALLAKERLGKQLGPLVHSQLFLGQAQTVTELLRHPLFQTLDNGAEAKLIGALRKLAANYQVGRGAAALLPKGAVAENQSMLTEAERERLQSEAVLERKALEDLLDQIQSRRPEFAEAFRWALQTQRNRR